MSTVMASYTTAVSRSPVLLASSVVPARSSWRPTVGFQSSAAIMCWRPLTVTCAFPEKERPVAFSIPPTALLCPVSPPDGKERWNIKEEANCVRLCFQVPGLSEENIEVTVSDDMLEIKSKGGASNAATDVHGVGAFYIRLLMTKEYDTDSNNVKAELKAGMLEVTVAKRPDSVRGVKYVTWGPQAGQGDGAEASKGSLGEEKAQGGGEKRGAGSETGASGNWSSSS